jgi:hypothetical protein
MSIALSRQATASDPAQLFINKRNERVALGKIPFAPARQKFCDRVRVRSDEAPKQLVCGKK